MDISISNNLHENMENTMIKCNEEKNIFKNYPLKPAFAEKNVPILLCANDKYAKYLAIVLQSIQANSSIEYNYDIIIFTRDISIQNKKILLQQVSNLINFSLRFYDVTKAMQEYTDLHLDFTGRLSLETYFRLLAPFVLTEYDKIIYLDCDIVVQEDLAKLYAVDLQKEKLLLAACHDPCIILAYHLDLEKNVKNTHKTFQPNFSREHYLQAGVLIINLLQFRQDFTFSYVFDLAKSKKWTFHDQDILNYLSQNRVQILNMQWNVIAAWLPQGNRQDKKHKIKKEKRAEIEEYYIAKQNPYIIHYAARAEEKPWHDDNREFANIWWDYAKETVYYPILQKNLIAHKKEYNCLKNKCKRLLKKVLMPFVNLFFPKGSERREKLKKKYFKKNKR